MGASIAYNLSRRNADVTVIDHAQPGSGASSHSFAWLNSFGKEPAAYHDLNRRSMNMWERFARRLNADIGLRWGGEVRWVSTDEDARELSKRVSVLQSRGYASRMIDEDELRALEPGLNVERFAAGEFSENDGHVDPPRVVEACLSHVRANGGVVRSNTVTAGLKTGGDSKISVIQTQAGDIECDAVVVAAGIGTTQVAALAGVDVPQEPTSGVVGLTSSIPQILKTACVLHTPPIDAERRELHLRQYEDGRLMIGEGSQESVSSDDSQEHADRMLARAAYRVPAIKGATITPVPVGYRPMPKDGLPILGFTEAVPNMYVAVMHSGVTLAALVGELSAIEILDGAKVDLFEPYRLERFA